MPSTVNVDYDLAPAHAGEMLTIDGLTVHLELSYSEGKPDPALHQEMVDAAVEVLKRAGNEVARRIESYQEAKEARLQELRALGRELRFTAEQIAMMHEIEEEDDPERYMDLVELQGDLARLQDKAADKAERRMRSVYDNYHSTRGVARASTIQFVKQTGRLSLKLGRRVARLIASSGVDLTEWIRLIRELRKLYLSVSEFFRSLEGDETMLTRQIAETERLVLARRELEARLSSGDGGSFTRARAAKNVLALTSALNSLDSTLSGLREKAARVRVKAGELAGILERVLNFTTGHARNRVLQRWAEAAARTTHHLIGSITSCMEQTEKAADAASSFERCVNNLKSALQQPSPQIDGITKELAKAKRLFSEFKKMKTRASKALESAKGQMKALEEAA